MASDAYRAWVKVGRPYRLCTPAKGLQAALQGHGLTVYDYPDDSHLVAEPPEDHTPFAATGWPKTSAFGVAHAIDIMPRADTPAGRAESANIARRLIADRNAGVPGVLWIKYINWTDESGACRQERWMPDHTTRPSTDKGHIHVSGRSDCDDDTRAGGYDPLSTGDSMAENYAPYGAPTHFVANRSEATMVADVWSQEQYGKSPYDGTSASARTAQLGRIEAELQALLASVDAVRAELADLKTSLQLGGIAPAALDDALDRALGRLAAKVGAAA